MSLTFLIGAFIGSGVFIVLGRGPAQKLVDAVAGPHQQAALIPT